MYLYQKIVHYFVAEKAAVYEICLKDKKLNVKRVEFIYFSQ